MSNFNNVYKGKTVLVTGHTGFKGSWLSIWLTMLGANVVGYALEPYSQRGNYKASHLEKHLYADVKGDIRDSEKLEATIAKYKPEIIFHLAAQALVRTAYDNPKYTYETNVIGSLNILEAVRKFDFIKTVVMITSDKCYENVEQIWGYKETDRMGGYDPYSSSKGCAELMISSYRNSYFNPKDYAKHGKAVASVRAGNVIGGGDWSDNRLVPDCIRFIEEGKDIEIRSPKATRPWEHVLEPLSGYLRVGQKLMEEPVKYSDLICELTYPYKIKKKVIQRKVVFVYNEENNRIIEHNNTKDDPSNNTDEKSTLPYQDYSKISYCYVATCVYGSYNCKQVYTLRRYRDYKLAKSIPGKIFIKTYYFIGSRAVKLFGKYKWFNHMFRPMLDRMVIKLNKKGYLDTPYND